MAGAGGNGLFSEHVVFYIESFGMLLVIAAVGCTPIPKKIVADFIGKRESLSAVIVENLFLASVLLLCLAFLTGDSYNPFLYFRF
jgi:alginate O-acetyltransferase complex protein AlgI